MSFKSKLILEINKNPSDTRPTGNGCPRQRAVSAAPSPPDGTEKARRPPTPAPRPQTRPRLSVEGDVLSPQAGNPWALILWGERGAVVPDVHRARDAGMGRGFPRARACP